MNISRKGFLMSIGCATAGAAGGILARDQIVQEAEPENGKGSFAQAGEDVQVDFIFDYLNVKAIHYLDIGAYDPIKINNTYFFYQKGRRGVLIEPNATMCEHLRAVRPRDTTLVAGIGVSAAREADYYVMTDSSWNTFSKEEAEHQARATSGKIRIRYVRKVPLLNINDVMAEHFKQAPAFVSIDAEGLHLAILQSIDYGRFRPKVICVETLVSGTTRTIPEIPAFMATKGYVPRGGSFVNTIFVDSQLL